MKRYRHWLQVLLAAALLGTTFQAGTGCIGTIARNVNPCGTILVCDPLEYDLMWTDQSDWPDYNIDPTCTIPGECGETPFPPAGSGTSASGVGTSGTTNTTTTTGNTGGFFGFGT